MYIGQVQGLVRPEAPGSSRAAAYLVLAALLVAVSAPFIPIAETTWRGGRGSLWWTALVPAAAVLVFFSAAEGVHVVKAGAGGGQSGTAA